MLYIITPCSRPQNLSIIANTIPIDSKWIIVHDNHTDMPLINNATFFVCEDTGLVGTKARNFALDNINFSYNDHILFHDDDNIIHPLLYSTVSQVFDHDFSLLCWGQLNKDNSIRLLPPKSIKVGQIDTASFLIKWKYNSHVRHRTDIYEHDGYYAEECAKNGLVLRLNEFLCYYNYLNQNI